MLVVVVTGMSGAGKSTVLRALEDLAYFCVDNLPVPVLPSTLDACDAGGMRRVGLGIDVRVRSFLEKAPEALARVAEPGRREVQIVFLDAQDDVLLRRFSSTRRPHPLRHAMKDGESRAMAVLDGVKLEREWLAPLRAKATHVIDTTSLSVHDLRRRILAEYGPAGERNAGMQTRVLSFGFKYGAPADADLVLDVRFLDNPFFVDALRPLSGLDAPVREHVLAHPDAEGFLARAMDLLVFCLPRYEREGKAYLTLAIGCTGGRHRSVVVAEALADRLRRSAGVAATAVHRDVSREAGVPGE